MQIALTPSCVFCVLQNLFHRAWPATSDVSEGMHLALTGYLFQVCLVKFSFFLSELQGRTCMVL